MSAAELINILLAVFASALTAAGLFWAVIRSILRKIDEGDGRIWAHVRNVESRKADKTEVERVHSDLQTLSVKLDNHHSAISTRMDQLLLAYMSNGGVRRGND